MSSPTIKRVRVEENIEGGNDPEESSGNPSQQLLGNGDTEIFSTLIPLMEDLDVLKTCRLVCKSWNKFACLAIRKLPWVFFPINEYEYEDTKNHGKLMAANKKLGLPSPFRNFKVYAEYLEEGHFVRFLKYLRDNGENYSIDLRKTDDLDNGDTNPGELQTVFTSNLNNFNITKLTLYGLLFLEDGPHVDVFQPENIRLPHLKTLKIKYDALRDDKLVTLCETLCHNSPLKFLQIGNNHEGEALKKVFSPGGMKSLENLVMTVENTTILYEDWRYICARIKEIPSLKKLTMRFLRQDEYDWWYLEGFAAIIEHFAHSLESVKGEPLPPIQTTCCFPKLREIQNTGLTSDYQFSYPKDLFPLLTKATFVYTGEGPMVSPCGRPCCALEESCGIEEIYFSYRGNSQNLAQLMKLVGVAGTVFPNVSIFSLDVKGHFDFTRGMFKEMFNSAPKLTSLQLRLDLQDGRILLGKNVSVDGRPLENIPRGVSLLDFPDLEKLILGPHVVMQPCMFKCCFSKMPKLKYLSFYVYRNVSVESVRDIIGDLRMTIVIYVNFLDCCEKRLGETERMRLVLPSGGEIRKIKV